MERPLAKVLRFAVACASLCFAAAGVQAQQPARPGQIPIIALPDSSLLTAEERAYAAKKRAAPPVDDGCGDVRLAPVEKAPAIRKCQAEAYLKSRDYAAFGRQFDYVLTPVVMGGVYTQVVTPKTGVAPKNKGRVLINLHGSGFYIGSRTISLMESIPIAALGGFKVVSVDYRMAPEARFPAASEDVERVYRELLKTYKPEQIGIYGCSAGALLAAESIAWFRTKGLPRPGAIAMLCEGAAYWTEGDSGYFLTSDPATFDKSPYSFNRNGYFSGVSDQDPLAIPLRSAEVMASFPPTLLVSSTRDFGLSSVARTHATLRKLGVPADLFVFEGLPHAFFFDPDRPESRQVYDTVISFFDNALQR